MLFTHPFNTKNEVLTFISILEDLKIKNYHNNSKDINLSSYPSKHVTMLQHMEVVNLNELNSNRVSINMQKADELLKYMSEMDYINVTLAFYPSMKFIQQLRSILVPKGVNNVLLNINLDPSVIGGAIIDYKGLYHDLSLRQTILSYIRDKKDDILSKL